MNTTQTPMHKRLQAYFDSGIISRKIVAQNAGITESQLSLILNGKRRISVDFFEILCRAMAVDPKRFYESA